MEEEGGASLWTVRVVIPRHRFRYYHLPRFVIRFPDAGVSGNVERDLIRRRDRLGILFSNHIRQTHESVPLCWGNWVERLLDVVQHPCAVSGLSRPSGGWS